MLLPTKTQPDPGSHSGFGDKIMVAHIARWKTGYVVAYSDKDWNSYIFFLDKNFSKQAGEFRIEGRTIYRIITDNQEIALLTGVTAGKREKSDFVYWTKVNKQGKILKEVEIVGSKNVRMPFQSELDDWGNFQMIWTGQHYFCFFPIQHNFSKVGVPDVHQGDCIYLVSPEGELLSYSEWGASHSFEQRLLNTENYSVTIAKGDAYPRGLSVNFVGRKTYSTREVGITNPDQNNRKIKTHYSPEERSSCVPFKVSGATGNNYVPFSIGDAIVFEKDELLVSFSSKDRKRSHDIGLVRVRPEYQNCSNDIHWLTNTDKISEHSIRMQKLDENRVLILWKEFDINDVRTEIIKMKKELSYTEHHRIADEDMFNERFYAIIDRQGNYLVKPKKLEGLNWYNTIGLKESNTDWHDLMSSYADHRYSKMIIGHNSEIIWLYHNRAKGLQLISIPTSTF